MIYQHVQKLERAVEKYRYHDKNDVYYDNNNGSRSDSHRRNGNDVNSGGGGVHMLNEWMLHNECTSLRWNSSINVSNNNSHTDSQEIVWNSRNVEAITDSLINEDEEEDLEDDDHRHASADDGNNVGDRKDPATLPRMITTMQKRSMLMLFELNRLCLQQLQAQQ
jgi:hypothetical protein